MKKLSKFLSLALVAILSLCAVACADSGSNQTPKEFLAKDVKNVIILIGDGMGQGHIKAGEIYKGEKLNMQGMPYVTTVETRSASAEITDSSAAATAMATGTRTNNKYVGLDADGQTLKTIVDIAKEKGKSTGIITSEELYGGTPMGFSGHSNNRNDYVNLIKSAASSGNVDLFAGCNFEEEYADDCFAAFSNNGYALIEDVEDISSSTKSKILGVYGIKGDAPSMSAQSGNVALNKVVLEALEYLSKDKDGFFLMAEGAHIDHGGEERDLEYVVRELMAFDDMIGTVLDWAKDRNDTIVLVTADHETGGLDLKETITKENMFDRTPGGNWQHAKFNTSGHSARPVNCYFFGPKFSFADYSTLNGATQIKNTDIFTIMKTFVEIKG